jgi:hypothetical protein
MKKLKNLKSYLTNRRKLEDGKITQSSNVVASQDTLGDQSSIQMLESMEQLSFVQSIRDVSLLTFIQCCVYGNYEGIVVTGNPNEEEIYKAWCFLLSQYLVARSDNSVQEKLEVISKMKYLEFRIEWINAIVLSLHLRFTETIANELRDAFPDFEFTEESFYNDIQLLKNMEIENKILYSELEDSLKLLNKDIQEKTKEQSEIDFYESVASYNRVFKTSEKVKDMNALEHAINCKAYEKYCEDNNKLNQDAGSDQ